MAGLKNNNNKILENLLIKHGNKNTSELIFKKTVKYLQKNNKKSHLNIFKFSIANSYNILLLKTPKIKKLQYKIPYIIKKKRRIILSIKTIIAATKNRSKAKFFINFNEELLYLAKIKSSNAQSDFYKTVYMQKIFAHYRWFV